MDKKQLSRRMVYFSSFGMLLTLLCAIAWAAAEPQYDPIARTRIVMSLIRGEFDESTGNLVLISLADANTWAEAFYDAYGPLLYPEDHPTNPGEPIPWASLTSEQRGKYYLRQLRRYHIEVRRGADVPAAVDTAKADAEAAVDVAAQIFPEIEVPTQ